ncbi:hypothetical protein NN561_008865 [Cricetulus griseus]
MAWNWLLTPKGRWCGEKGGKACKDRKPARGRPQASERASPRRRRPQDGRASAEASPVARWDAAAFQLGGADHLGLRWVLRDRVLQRAVSPQSSRAEPPLPHPPTHPKGLQK